jgi:hypothetical protein
MIGDRKWVPATKSASFAVGGLIDLARAKQVSVASAVDRVVLVTMVEEPSGRGRYLRELRDTTNADLRRVSLRK